MHPLLLFTLLFLPGTLNAAYSEIVKKELKDFPVLVRPHQANHRFSIDRTGNKPLSKPSVSFKKDEAGHNVYLPNSQGTKTNVRGTIEYFSSKLDKESGEYVPNGYIYHKFEIKGPEKHSPKQVTLRKPISTFGSLSKVTHTCPYCKKVVSKSIGGDKHEICPHCKNVLHPPYASAINTIKKPKICSHCKNNSGKKLSICPLCKKLFMDSRGNSLTSNKYNICPYCRYLLMHSRKNILNSHKYCPCCPKSKYYDPIYSTVHCPCCKCTSRLATENINQNKTSQKNILVRRMFLPLNMFPFKSINLAKYKLNNRITNYPKRTENYTINSKPKDISLKKDNSNNGLFTRKLYTNDFKPIRFVPLKLYNEQKQHESSPKHITDIEKEKLNKEKSKNFHVEIFKDKKVDITFHNLYKGKESKNKISKNRSDDSKNPTSSAIMKINSKEDEISKNLVMEKLKNMYPILSGEKILDGINPNSGKSKVYPETQVNKANLFRFHEPSLSRPAHMRYQKSNDQLFDDLFDPYLF